MRRFVIGLGAVLLTTLLTQAAFAGSTTVYTLTEANTNFVQPIGTVTVTGNRDCSLPGGCTSLMVSVTLAPGFHFAAGNTFGFNLPAGGTVDQSSIMLAGASSVTVDLSPHNSLDGFGKYTVNFDTVKTAVLGSTLTFTITGTNLTTTGFMTSSGGTGTSFFTMHVFGPTITGGTDTGFVGGSGFTTVPEPGTMIFLGTGLMGLAGILRRRVVG